MTPRAKGITAAMGAALASAILSVGMALPAAASTAGSQANCGQTIRAAIELGARGQGIATIAKKCR